MSRPEVGGALIRVPHRKVIWLLKVSLLAVTTATLSGCYTFHPIASEQVTPGTTVRAELTGDGIVKLVDMFGEPRRTVMGEVIQFDGSNGRGLLLSTAVPTPTQVAGVANQALRQRIQLEARDFVRIEERRLDRVRTLGLSAAVTAGLVSVAVYFLTGTARGEVDRSPQEPPVS